MRGSIPKEGVTRRSVITPDVIRLDVPRETRGALFEDGRGMVDKFSASRRVKPNVKGVAAARALPRRSACHPDFALVRLENLGSRMMMSAKAESEENHGGR